MNDKTVFLFSVATVRIIFTNLNNGWNTCSSACFLST